MTPTPLPHVHDFCAPPGEADISGLRAHMNLRQLRGQSFFTAREALMLLDWPRLDKEIGVQGPLQDALNQARLNLIRQREWLPARPDLSAVNLAPLSPGLLRDHPLMTAAEFTAVGQIALLAAVAAEARHRAMTGEAVIPYLHLLRDFTGLFTLPATETSEPDAAARRRWTWTQPPPGPVNLTESAGQGTAFLASAGPARQTGASAGRSRSALKPKRLKLKPLKPKRWWSTRQGTSPGQGHASAWASIHASGRASVPATVILNSPAPAVRSWTPPIPGPDDLGEAELRDLLRGVGFYDDLTGLVAGLMVSHICEAALRRAPTTERDWADQAVLRAGLPSSDVAVDTSLYLPWPRPGTEPPALWSAQPPSLWSSRPLRWNGLHQTISSLGPQLARTPVARAADGTLEAPGLLTALLPLSRAQTQALLWLRAQATPGETRALLQALLTALNEAPPPPLRWRPRAAQLRRDLQHALTGGRT